MGAHRCHLEIYVGRAWQLVGSVAVDAPERGFESPSSFDYDLEYLERHPWALGARDWQAVSARFEVGYHAYRERSWPAFLLALVPSGAADWELLLRGGGNPLGNVRVREAVESRVRESSRQHPGFTRADVVERAGAFVAYARAHGTTVAGGGDAPKLLLREDHDGRFHADGALDDERTSRAWLVKFPRSDRADDRSVLEAESAYLRVAERCGVRVGAAPQWERDALFVPRFDRVVEYDGHVRRLGLESLCSLSGVASFGVAAPKERLVHALATHVSAAARETELRELLLRDVLDLALGNTDNHARNTALLKSEDGRVVLSPLFGFAPMFLDTRGIDRVCQWKAERSGVPDWSLVLDGLEKHGLDRARTMGWLHERLPTLRELPRFLVEEAVPAWIGKRVLPMIERTLTALEALR